MNSIKNLSADEFRFVKDVLSQPGQVGCRIRGSGNEPSKRIIVDTLNIHLFSPGDLKKIILSVFILFSALKGYSQTASIAGTVRDKATQEPLVGVTLVIENSSPVTGTVSDPDGNFKLTTIPGSYNVTASIVGYKPVTKFNVLFTSGNINTINVELEEEATTLSEVVVEAKKTAEAATIETPLSVQRLTTEEIRSNPGGNFDISRVIQALPGVGGATGTASFRNDIIIRGGAPNENVYYLDGIEIPVINHFSTQGSAGGPQGILNVSFIEDVTLSTSAFEARYDNVLSSVLQFRQRSGNTERLQGNVRLSATELATTLDGPLGKNTTFLTSARRSYLKFIFQLIDLPIRPDYWDFQYKITHKFSPKTTLSLIGVGAIDRFKFAIPDQGTPENTYIIRSNPLINQETYTVGASLRHLIGGGYVNVAVSRNSLDNRLDKFEDGTMPIESQRTLKVRSLEAENKIRIDITRTIDEWKYSVGVVGNYAQFNNDVYSIIRKEIRDQNGNLVQPGLTNQYNTHLAFLKSGAFAQLSKRINRFNASAGVRADVNTFTRNGINPLKTLSPRVGLSYSVNDRWNINASVGRYYKLPVYTILGYKDQDGFINRDSKYIQSDHYVGGIEFLPTSHLRFTVEGFYKKYQNYPVSIRDGISVANSGTQFGQVGNEPVLSMGRGRAYGVEFFAQQKLTKNSFFTFSYTWFKSEFSGVDGAFIPSAWDNRNLLSAILGRKFSHNWELGLKFRYAGASPYTPFDLAASQTNYLSTGDGVFDYSRVNSRRLNAFKQIDVRIDKKWNLRQTTIDVFVDVQNIANFNAPGSLSYTFKRNDTNTDFETTDGAAVRPDGSNAIPLILKNTAGTILPTIGFIVEF